MKKKLVLNADDLGFSYGINEGILKAHQNGFLTHASLMANVLYFDHAVNEVISKCPELKIGIHINLTCGKALNPEFSLAKNGNITADFIQLLFLRKTKKKLKEIEKEIELQILKIKAVHPNISHIDSHEHVHIIPSINKIVRKLAAKHNILRVREINEDFFESIRVNWKTTSYINIIKLFLLKTLSLFNHNKNEEKFFSILTTCEIHSESLFKYLLETRTYKNIEIMLHPAVQGLDDEEYFKTLHPRFIPYFKDKHRSTELELCFDKRFEKYF